MTKEKQKKTKHKVCGLLAFYRSATAERLYTLMCDLAHRSANSRRKERETSRPVIVKVLTEK
jgi:hypothetical protein